MTNFKDRDCENCIHKVPKLNSDGTWTAECESWDCNYQNRKEILKTFNARKFIAKVSPEDAEKFKKAWNSSALSGMIIESGGIEITSLEKESSWIWQTYTNGFGTFKALRCERCGAKRNQVVLNYCASCGAKMNNADELGGVL